MVRRHARSPAFPSAYVFPGGTVHDDDQILNVVDGEGLAQALSARSDVPVQRIEAIGLYTCAVRELFEEAGVLLARACAGDVVVTLQEQLAPMRLAVQAHALDFAAVLKDRGWQPAFDRLVPFSHWITPPAMPARFDTRFFVAELPGGQSALHDEVETSEGIWLTPGRALQADYPTLFPTTEHLKRLAGFVSVSELLVFARRKPIRVVTPDVTRSPEGQRISLRPELIDAW